MQGKLLTLEEMAETLKVKKSWISIRVRDKSVGCIPRVMCGKYVRFVKEDVVNWLKIKTRNRWEPIITAPRDGSPILVYIVSDANNQYEEDRIEVVYFDKKDKRWVTYNLMSWWRDGDIEYWASLPRMPI